MSFEHPFALLLLAIPLLLGLREGASRRAGLLLPFDHAPLRRRRLLFGLLLGAQLLPYLLLAVVVLLLAGPRQLASSRVQREVTNIEICLDVSGSMGWSMGRGRTRYEGAMEAISGFTRARRGDACGLTIFGGEVVKWTPLTKDLDAIRLATPFLDPKKMPRHMNATRIGAALEHCLATLSLREQGDRLIVLISDGESQDLGGGNARRVGEDLAAAEVTLYAIHIGEDSPPAQLYEVVRPTAGQVFAANDASALGQIFAHIDAMEPARLEPSGAEPLPHERPFVLAGLALLALHLACALGLRYTPW